MNGRIAAKDVKEKHSKGKAKAKGAREGAKARIAAKKSKGKAKVGGEVKRCG